MLGLSSGFPCRCPEPTNNGLGSEHQRYAEATELLYMALLAFHAAFSPASLSLYCSRIITTC